MKPKRIYDLIDELIAAGQWDYLRGASDWAETKHWQYLTYRYILQCEPQRSYGFIQRVCSAKPLIISLMGGGIRQSTKTLCNTRSAKWSASSMPEQQ